MGSGGPVGKAAGRSRRSFAENEELDEGPNQQHDRELPEEETLRKRHSSPKLSVKPPLWRILCWWITRTRNG